MIVAPSFAFWQRWLLVGSCLLAASGLLVALFPEAFFLAPWRAGLADAFFVDGVEPVAAARVRRFLLAPLGATIAGTYVLQAFVAAGPFARREPWSWRASVAALLTWCVADTALSVAHGALFNVLLVNVPGVALIGLPLAMTRRAFACQPPQPPGA